jgi:hypothetical protein
MPPVPKNIAIMMIWYFAAINGDTPERICPVIIPGTATSFRHRLVARSFGLEAFCRQAHSIHRTGDDHATEGHHVARTEPGLDANDYLRNQRQDHDAREADGHQ